MAILSDAVARAPGLKFLLVALISVAMSVPLFFVFIALMDRQEYARTATADIARGWGGAQTIGGPVLAIPYVVTESQRNRRRRRQRPSTCGALRSFCPRRSTRRPTRKTQTRSRGIFDVNVYTGRHRVARRRSARPISANSASRRRRLQWDQAVFLLPIIDLQGLSENVSVSWGAAKTVVPFRPGLISRTCGLFRHQCACRVDGFEAARRRSRSRSNCAAPRDLHSRRRARRRRSTAKGNWPHPSFQGNFLPVTREISANGFTRDMESSASGAQSAAGMPTPENFVVRPSDRRASACRSISRSISICLVERALEIRDPVYRLGVPVVFLDRDLVGRAHSRRAVSADRRRRRSCSICCCCRLRSRSDSISRIWRRRPRPSC